MLKKIGLGLIGLVAVVAVVGALGGEDATEAQETSTTSTDATTTTVATTTTTTTTIAAAPAEIDLMGAGCVGYYDGAWTQLDVLSPTFDADAKQALVDCWSDQPAELADASHADEAYCLGYGAGAYTNGATEDEAIQLRLWCEDDAEELSFAELSANRFNLLADEGVEAWWAVWGIAE
jgi:hypothetical protein